jgi:dipeptidyl aminopeptidase/acylaminoacyl peptidase
VVDWFGPTDMVEWATNAPPQGAMASLFGSPARDHLDLVKQANPIAYIGKDCPPFFIMHGDKDPVVPLQHSQLIYDALKKNGTEATLEVLPGAGHGGPQFNAAEEHARIAGFLDKYLKQ